MMIDGSLEIKSNKRVLSPDHPLMIKYQNDLNERLLKLIQEAGEHQIDLKRSIEAQEIENKNFAERGYELQKKLKTEGDKLSDLVKRHNFQHCRKKDVLEKCEKVREKFQFTDNTWKTEIQASADFQQNLEKIAFEVVQLTSLKSEAYTGSKSVQCALEKITKDRENLELEKLRQDLLVARLENDKFKLEDKINLHKVQWGIKREEAADLRKELNAAKSEIESIQFEKQQIVHQWKQSLASLTRQDQVLSHTRDAMRLVEDKTRSNQLDVDSCKKFLRKELERNEQLTHLQQLRENDIARVEVSLREALERSNDLEENIDMLQKTVEITDNEHSNLSEEVAVREKELEVKEREFQKAHAFQRSLEKKYMDVLHEKLTITKASKSTEKQIKDIKNTIRLNVELGAKKESEREKLLLKLDNMRIYVENLDSQLDSLLKERAEREEMLEHSEDCVLKSREKIDGKRGEKKQVENQLKEMVLKAGGEELAPIEREMHSLRKEITVTEQGQRSMEKEYLRFQHDLFSINKQAALKSEENDFYQKKMAVLEGKKIELETDILKEEKSVKDIQNQIQVIQREIVNVNNILCKRNELQENLIQATTLTKSDFFKLLKEAELNNFQRENELKLLKRKKRKQFCKLLETQRYIVYWEGKIHLAEETRKIIKSEDRIRETSAIKNEIRRLQVKQEHMRKQQNNLMQELENAVFRHTNLYIEADKQVLYGKRKKSPEYIQTKIKQMQKKTLSDKKLLHDCVQRLEEVEHLCTEINDSIDYSKSVAVRLVNDIKTLELGIDSKEQEKRQSVIELSFKQKHAKFLQKVTDGTYIRAVRSEVRRTEELGKLNEGLQTVQNIAQDIIKEYPDMEKALCKVNDFVLVSRRW